MVVNIWWGTWIVGNLLGLILNYSTPREAAIASMSAEEYLSALTLLLFVGSGAALSTIISCFCLLTVAKQVTTAQESLRSTSAFDA